MASPRSAACSLLVLCLLGACDDGSTPDQACGASARAQCAKLDQCRHHGVADVYGTLDTCISRLQDDCLRALRAPGAAAGNPVTVALCAQLLPAESCQDYLQGNPVMACQPPQGSLPDGSACAGPAQCFSAFCDVPRGSLCGTCQEAPKIGDPCPSGGCGIGQVCTPLQKCQAYVKAGGTCDGMYAVCAPGESCVIAAGAVTGTCLPSAVTAGAACDPRQQTAPGCDANAGLFCAPTRRCVAFLSAQAGELCGPSDQGMNDHVCTGGAGCYPPGAATPICLALGREGEACDLLNGPGCMPPDRCVVQSGTGGTCMAPDPLLCF